MTKPMRWTWRWALRNPRAGVRRARCILFRHDLRQVVVISTKSADSVAVDGTIVEGERYELKGWSCWTCRG